VRLALRDPLRDFDDARDGISPSNGQPNAAEIVTCARMPAASRSTRDFQPGVDGLVGADTLVAAIECVAGHHDHADFAAAGGRGAIEAFAIHHQSDEMGVARAVETGQHLLGIGHLRDLARIDEAGDLDAAQAGSQQTGDELDLGGGGEDQGVDLQPSRGPTSTIST
jgi:hypothetical protein